MSWLDKIRQKSDEDKIRLTWVVTFAAAIILIILWVLTAKFGKNVGKDTSLFETISKGIQDIRDNYKK